jgi:16S rRNA (guanine966-N2)-methyltransferase
MRVIAGSARGFALRGPASDATRPTSDKVRGAIFAMLEHMVDLEDARVLDLYAGTGALGIEALSRGASWCDFVEQDRGACRVIAENLAHTKLSGQAKVHTLTVERVLSHPETLGRHFTDSPGYDIMLLDPPYADTSVWDVIARLPRSPLWTPGATLVLEHGKRANPPADAGGLTLLKKRCHGDTCVSFYQAAAPAGADPLPEAGAGNLPAAAATDEGDSH